MALRDLDRTRAGWWAVGVVLAATLAFVVHSFVGTVVFGIFLYYATRPIYARVRRVVRPSSLAAAVSLFALALPALLLTSYALLVALNQLRAIVDGAPSLIATLGLDPALLDRVRSPRALLTLEPRQYLSAEQAVELLRGLGSAVDTLAVLGIAAVHLFVMTAIAFYLLRDDHRLARWATDRFGDDRGVLEAYLDAVDDDFLSIFFGNILNAVLTGTIGVVVYSLLNTVAPPGLSIPVAALVGLLAGVASLIPVVGMKLVYVPVTGYLALLTALADFEGVWFVAVFALVSLVVVDTIPDLVLRPYVSGRSLHVGAVMLAYTLGPLLFGWYGVFLMPMLLVLVFEFARIVLPELLDGERIRPFAVDPGYRDADADGPPAESDSSGFEFGPSGDADGRDP
jgi:predicted PurR-regulated permease PerM